MRIILVFLLSVVTWGQNQKTDWQKENLKGNVKSVKIFSYKYTDNNGKIENKQPLSNFNTLENYNAEGYKTSGERFSDSGEMTSRWVYSYDNIQKRLVQVDIFDEKVRVQEIIKYSYNPKTKKEEIIGYDANGKFSGKQIACYDEQGNKINELSLDEKEQFLLKMESFFDEKSLLKEKHFEDKNGKKAFLKYVYDSKNNVIEENYYGENNQQYGQKKFSYTKYDKQGNWTERIEFIYGAERIVTERQIDYFKK